MSYYKGPFSFGQRSARELATVDPILRAVLEEAIQIIDFTVVEGHRDRGTQNKFYELGRSKVQWPKSKHNTYPSRAVDVAPFPIEWTDHRKDQARFYLLCGIIYAISVKHGVKLRFGADWDGDFNFKDQTFDDLAHIEILD